MSSSKNLLSSLPKLPSIAQVDAEKIRRGGLREFIKKAWHVVEPATAFVPNWHIDAIADHLEAVSRGEIKRLLITIPPRHMKSLSTSVFWPAWEWTFAPSIRWLFSSYAESLAIRDALKTRRLITSDWYRARWGHLFELTSDQNVKGRYDNNHTGYRISMGLSGAITGEGGDRIAVDDAHNIKEADSDQVRKSVLTWWDEVMSTRFTDPATTARVITMQRVHEKDLAGHVLESGKWEHLRIPAELDSQRTTTVIGWEDPRKEEGELLWPKRFTQEVLDDLKEDLGSFAYAGQFQQTPMPRVGADFKSEWFRYYTGWPEKIVTSDGRVMPLESLRRFATMDLAVSKRHTADYTVIASWGVFPTKKWEIFLLGLFRKRIGGHQYAKEMEKAIDEYNLMYVVIEDAGMQLAIIEQAVEDGLRVKGIEADQDKRARALAATPVFEAGRVHFPRGAPFMPVLENELLQFPKGDHDDQVDAVAYAMAMGKAVARSAPRPLKMKSKEPAQRGLGVPAWMKENQRKAERARRGRGAQLREELKGLQP